MSTLFELSADLRELDRELENIQESELTEEEKSNLSLELVDSYLLTEELAKEKILNCARYIKELEALTKIRKEEAARITQLAKVSENRANNLRKYVANHMNVLGIDRCEGVDVKLNLRKKPPELVLKCEPEQLPEIYQRVTIEPNKRYIREAINKNLYRDTHKWAELVPTDETTLTIK
jgi:hypothetical protein